MDSDPLSEEEAAELRRRCEIPGAWWQGLALLASLRALAAAGEAPT